MSTPKFCGFLNVAKPANCTSRDVVNQIQPHFRNHKVGHAGTLDPMATGVLVVAIGRATKLIRFIQRMPKTYVAEFKLGIVSDTDDIWGKLRESECPQPPNEQALLGALKEQIGCIMQTPPKFAALKVDGTRAYKMARIGRAVEMSPRQVQVFDIRSIRYEFPMVELEIDCGSGTYIRSIARDVGLQLECGAVLSRLMRSAIGSFRIDDAIDIDRVDHDLAEYLIPPAHLFDKLPKIQLGPLQLENLRHGRPIDVGAELAGLVEREEIAVLSPNGEFTALLQLQPTGEYHPLVNWAPSMPKCDF